MQTNPRRTVLGFRLLTALDNMRNRTDGKPS